MGALPKIHNWEGCKRIQAAALDICCKQFVFHYFLNLQNRDSTSEKVKPIFPCQSSQSSKTQVNGTSVGVVKNKCYLVNHARFQFLFCDVIMAPLLVLEKKTKQTPTASFPVVVTNAFMAEPQINNAGIPN